jgi:hypothetical protein
LGGLGVDSKWLGDWKARVRPKPKKGLNHRKAHHRKARRKDGQNLWDPIAECKALKEVTKLVAIVI